MTIEEKLRSSLAEGLAGFDGPPGDLAAVQQRGRRLRRNRRLLVSGAVLAVVVGGGAVFAGIRAGDDRGVEPVDPGGTWQSLDPAPVSPRWDALSGWTGTEALFIGGGTGTPCPPNADCAHAEQFARDGAAYNPTTQKWRTIAAAPVPMAYYFRTVMVGDTMVVFGDRDWYAYDAGEDSWRTLSGPPVTIDDTGSLSASSDGRVYAMSRSGVVEVLDVSADSWSALPASELRPRLTQRSVVAAGDRIVVSGYHASSDPTQAPVVSAQAWDGTSWTWLPATRQLGSDWHWTGQRLVDLDLQTADGGEVDGWGETYPYGGRLDPDSGAWTPLPNAPDLEKDRVEGWSMNAADGPLMAGWGYAYDDGSGRWVALGAPQSAVDVDQSAVWAEGRLIVFGGVDEETGYQDVSGLSNDSWVWTP